MWLVGGDARVSRTSRPRLDLRQRLGHTEIPEPFAPAWHRKLGMAESLLKKLVRNFPENGPKLLLENSANVHDLLVLLHEPQVHAIDFTAMTVERTHFVQPDLSRPRDTFLG
jgi:hypothetical protein